MKKTVYEWLMAVGHRAGCHQRADRSFYWKGRKFPLCARCTGVLVGYSRCASVYGLQKERERVCRLLYPTGDRRFNSAMGVAGVYQSKKICNRRFSGIWYLLYGDNVAVIRKKFNAKELVKDVLSKLRYGN